MLNRSNPASPFPTPGVRRCSQYGIILCTYGGGMTVALSDVVLVHDLFQPHIDLIDATSLCRYLQPFYKFLEVRM